jgi:hypothetical protein
MSVMRKKSPSPRPLRRTRQINWKRWTLIVFLSAGAGFILHQAISVITNRPPAWLTTRAIKGSALAGGLGSPLSRFREMADDARQESSRLRVPLGPVQLYEVRKRNAEVIVWSLERFTNPGFDPQTRFQHALKTSYQQLIGYYTLEGKPIPAVVRELTRSEGEPANVELTVAQPVSRGGDLFVIRLERGAKAILSPQTGNYYLSLNYPPSTNVAVACRGIQLPRGADIVRYVPSDGAWAATEGAPMLSWRNSQLKAKDPAPSLTFKMPP